jgi:type IV secretory pathway VirB10-like protein
MSIDVKHRLDEKIRKLQMLRELADDPETLAMIRELVAGEPTSDSEHRELPSHPVDAQHKNTESPHPFPFPPAGEGRKRGRLVNRGKQAPMVEQTLRSATAPVTSDWIVERMKAAGYTFQASKPRIAVNDTLRALREKGRARITHTEGLENYWEAVKADATTGVQ